MSKTPVHGDVLGSIEEITAYIYGVVTEQTKNRIRHKIRKGHIPAIQHARNYESRRSWIDGVYNTPTNLGKEE